MFNLYETQETKGVIMLINQTDIDALIDGELSFEEEEKLLAQIDTNPVMKKYYKDMLKQKSLLQDWWVHMGKKSH